MFAGARAARHDGATNRAAGEAYFGFNCWIAARIDNFARVNLGDFRVRHKWHSLGECCSGEEWLALIERAQVLHRHACDLGESFMS